MDVHDTIGNRERRDYWRINGLPVAPDPEEETRTYDSLEVVFRAPLEVVQNVLRPLREDAGSFSVLPRSDGGFLTIDTADGRNTHTVDAPADRQSIRRQREWLVAEYDEEMLDSSGEKFEVELTLVPQREKRSYGGYEEVEPASNEWLLDFHTETVATRRFSREIIETAEDGVEVLGIDLLLRGPEVRKVEEALSKLEAVNIKEQFDGSSTAEDNSPGDENTFYLRPPQGGEKTIAESYYIANAWETEWLAGDRYQVRIDALQTTYPPLFTADFSDDFERGRDYNPESNHHD